MTTGSGVANAFAVRFVAAGLLLVVVAAGGAASASDAPGMMEPTAPTAVDIRPVGEDPTEIIDAFKDKALYAFNQPGLDHDARDDLLVRLVHSHLDLSFASRLVLGPYRMSYGPELFSDYREVFDLYVPLVFSRRFAPFRTARLDVNPEPVMIRKKLAVVTSTLHLEDGQVVRTDWRLRRQEEGWRIIDVILENLSLADSMRKEFQAAIAAQGGKLEPLIEQMRVHNEELKSTPIGPDGASS